MKKTGIIISLCILWLVSPTVMASQEESYEQLAQNSGFTEMFQGLTQEIQDTLEQFGVTPATLFSGEGFSLKGVWNRLLWYVQGCMKTPVRAMGTVMAMLLICLLFQTLFPTKNNSMQTTFQFFSGFCITVALAIPVSDTITKTVSALAGIGGFIKLFLPAYVAVLLVMGKRLTVSGAGGLVFGYCQVLSYLAQNVILPFISMFQAFAICEAAGGGVRVTGFATCVKRVAMWVMGISATAFSGILCLTGFINGAGDSVFQRTGRFFIGNMIPVVGGALSDSMAIIQGSFSLLRSGGGVFGVVVVLAFAIPPLLEIVLWRVVLMVLVAVSGVMEMPRVTALLQAVNEGVGLLLGVVLCSVAVAIVGLAVLVLAGG